MSTKRAAPRITELQVIPMQGPRQNFTAETPGRYLSFTTHKGELKVYSGARKIATFATGQWLRVKETCNTNTRPGQAIPAPPHVEPIVTPNGSSRGPRY